MTERTYKSRFPASLPTGDKPQTATNGEVITPEFGPLSGTPPFSDFDDPASNPYYSFAPSITQGWRELPD